MMKLKPGSPEFDKALKRIHDLESLHKKAAGEKKRELFKLIVKMREGFGIVEESSEPHRDDE